MNGVKLHDVNRDQLESLVQTVRILTEDIETSFELDKCEVLEMIRGRKVNSKEIEPRGDQHISELEIE